MSIVTRGTLDEIRTDHLSPSQNASPGKNKMLRRAPYFPAASPWTSQITALTSDFYLRAAAESE